MMRQPVNENDFCTEISKMIMKEKYEKTNRVDMNASFYSNQSGALSDTLTSNEKEQ